jgi:hypothetical protein
MFRAIWPDEDMKKETYEATEEDYQRAELAAHKITPLFQLFGWKWHRKEGHLEFVVSPSAADITDEFIRLIEDRENNDSEALETGRLGVRKDGDFGYQLYLCL